jgi:hypothetical protein
VAAGQGEGRNCGSRDWNRSAFGHRVHVRINVKGRKKQGERRKRRKKNKERRERNEKSKEEQERREKESRKTETKIRKGINK